MEIESIFDGKRKLQVQQKYMIFISNFKVA